MGAVRARRRPPPPPPFAALAALYATLAVTALVLIFIAPTDAQGVPTDGGTALIIIGELLLLALVIAGCMHQMWLRRQVYHATATAPAIAPVPAPEPALAVSRHANS